MQASAHALEMAVYKECRNNNGVLDCIPTVGPSLGPLVLPPSDPTLVAMQRFISSLAALDLVLPTDQTEPLKKLERLAWGLVKMKMDPNGSWVLNDGVVAFANLTGETFQNCKRLVTGSAESLTGLIPREASPTPNPNAQGTFNFEIEVPRTD
jgi:hypothetical protein